MCSSSTKDASGKYSALTRYLAGLDAGQREITLSFAELGSVLGQPLPASARNHRPWWANQKDNAGRPQARAWMAAGFLVEAVDLTAGRVQFVRNVHAAAKTEPSRVTPQEHSPNASIRPPVECGPGTRAYLVSCVGQKAAVPRKAKDLYVSDWFNKVRQYVEQAGAPWFILSAEYGLVNAESVIAPYEKTLNTMGISARRDWAARVMRQLDTYLPACEEIVIFAGARYREFLMDDLRKRANRVTVPLEGLRIGEQLSWLGSHAPDNPQG